MDEDYLAYLVKKKNLSKAIETMAAVILKDARMRHLLAGASPISMAATALYLASNELGREVTQKEMAEASGVSEVTVRSSCKVLRNKCMVSQADRQTVDVNTNVRTR